LFSLTFGHGSRSRQSRVRLLVEAGNVLGGFLLGNVCLFLLQLFIQDRNLVSRGPGLGLRLLNFRLRLLYACPQLLVVEHGDDVSSGYSVSLAHSDFENTAARLGGHCRVVTFDSTAERNDAWRHWRRVEEHSPNTEPDGRENQNDNQRNHDSTGHRAGWLRIGRRRFWLCLSWLRCGRSRLGIWLRWVRRRRRRLRLCLGWLPIGTMTPQGRNRRIKGLDFLLCSFPLLLQLPNYFRHVFYHRRRLRLWMGFRLRLVLPWKFLRPVDHQLFRHFSPRLLDTVARRSPEFACRRYASEKSQICSAIRSTCSGVISNSGQSCFSRGPART